MQPITMKPFILVMEAVVTIEFKPDMGVETERVGVAKNWIS